MAGTRRPRAPATLGVETTALVLLSWIGAFTSRKTTLLFHQHLLVPSVPRITPARNYRPGTDTTSRLPSPAPTTTAV